MDEETYQKHLVVIRNGFREQFESGDKLALLDCIRWCHEYGLPFPHWALAALSRASGKYLVGVSSNFHDALFGARKDIGRHSNPATARRASRSHQLIYDLVTILRQRGLKGDRVYEHTEELLRILRISADNQSLIVGKDLKRRVPDAGTIKKRYEKMRNDGARPSGFAHLIPMMVGLGDPPRRGKK